VALTVTLTATFLDKIMKQPVNRQPVLLLKSRLNPLLNRERGVVQTQRRQSGFSLIEIMVVLVIMGLLVSIVAPNVLNKADQARVQKVKADFKSLQTTLKIYRLDNFNYPTSDQGLEALIDKPTVDPVPANWQKNGYLEEMPLDPWGRAYLYLSPAEYGDGDYDLLTLGADGVTGGEDQNKDLGSWMKPGDNADG
jgi:general secretion pathway protein G